MADETITAAKSKTAADKKATIDDAMVAFSAIEKACIDAQSVVADLEHEEASGLRGLFATIRAELRAAKPGASAPGNTN